MQYLESLPTSRGRAGSDWWFNTLTHSLLLGMVANRWADVGRICETLKTSWLEGPVSDDVPLQYAQVFFLIASAFRTEPMRNVADLESSVARGFPKRPRHLLACWQAVHDRDQAKLDAALVTSLERFKARPSSVLTLHGPTGNLPEAESVIHLAAIHLGLQPATLPDSLADFLITPASIGIGA
ncbi:MAG: hypothetical protein HY000_15295 [Planctomycetes bacterium]|nr:hypothetical protein [Planctomycetota bacterium]